MNDRSSELENYNELKFSREQSFFDKSLGIRWIIGFCFALCLFAILHFREERVEILDLGSIAPGYAVSQVDFDFFDEEATIILKQEAVRDIGKIFQISDKEIRQRRIEFENFLIYNQDWRNSGNFNHSSFAELYAAIDDLEKILTKLRFTDSRTLQKMRDLDILTTNYQVFAPNELSINNQLPFKIWEQIGKEILEQNPYNLTTVDFIINYFKDKGWQFEEDIPSQRTLRKRIQLQVPDKYTHVRAGSRIIDQGEKVTSRHIAMFQAMKKAVSEKSNLWHPATLAGSVIMSLLLTVVCWAYFHINQPLIVNSNRKLFMLITVIIITFALAKVTEVFLLSSKVNLMEAVPYPIIVPFAAILLCSLTNTGIATFSSGFLTIVLTIALSFERQGFMMINIIAALVAILSTRTLRRRKEIFVVCFKAWICSIIVIFSLHLYQNTLGNGMITDILSSAAFMLLTAILVVGFLPLFESTFRIMTDVTLMEYMDPNNDLLRRLSIEAPGTYQHSVVVGNLAEAAAAAIGANGLFCRVSTLYHDVGKIINPQYFTENQQGGINIHQLLTPKESVQVIIAHVSDGVALARKAGLPEQFIDIMKEHHGTTLAYYFYRKQLELMGGDKSKVDEKEFRYSGPKPRSKESAIIMISDSVEAASRSLEKINEETLNDLAHRLIREKAEDGQFDQCLLTFEELAIVKSTLVKTLVAYGHARIKYPVREQKNEGSIANFES
jgi:cyclic-di-AMP phosphodiesterase PgpH